MNSFCNTVFVIVMQIKFVVVVVVGCSPWLQAKAQWLSGVRCQDWRIGPCTKSYCVDIAGRIVPLNKKLYSKFSLLIKERPGI